MIRVGILYALISAGLFGASTPLAKLLLARIDPLMMAGLLYFGAGVGLAGLIALRRAFGTVSETPLQRQDFGWMALVVLFGGIGGPVFLMVGLAQSSAASASLLLNLEGLATMAIAWLVFRENVDRRLLLGAAAILAGAVLLTWQGAARLEPGAALIAAACLCWGIDNNLTRKLSGSDPLQIAMVKGLAAGAVNLGLAVGTGLVLPDPSLIALTGAIGFLGYGLSLALFVLALRHLGTARTGAYFSLAPFVGAGLAVLLMGDALTPVLAGAAGLMGLGLWLHLSERHDHPHRHEALTHSHRHAHDLHHQHDHPPGTPPGKVHSHLHTHQALSHSHPHYPDLHHRHRH